MSWPKDLKRPDYTPVKPPEADDFKASFSYQPLGKPHASWGVRIVKKILAFFFFWNRNKTTLLPEENIINRSISTETKQKSKNKSPDVHVYGYGRVNPWESPDTSTKKEADPANTKQVKQSASTNETPSAAQSKKRYPMPNPFGEIPWSVTKDRPDIDAPQFSVFAQPTTTTNTVTDDELSQRSMEQKETKVAHSQDTVANENLVMTETTAVTNHGPHNILSEHATEDVIDDETQPVLPEPSQQTMQASSVSDNIPKIPIKTLVNFECLSGPAREYAQKLPDAPENRCQHLQNALFLEVMYLINCVEVTESDRTEENRDIIEVLPHMQALQKATCSGDYTFTDEQYNAHCKAFNTFLIKIQSAPQFNKNIKKHEFSKIKAFEHAIYQYSTTQFPQKKSGHKTQPNQPNNRPINVKLLQKAYERAYGKK